MSRRSRRSPSAAFNAKAALAALNAEETLAIAKGSPAQVENRDASSGPWLVDFDAGP